MRSKNVMLTFSLSYRKVNIENVNFFLDYMNVKREYFILSFHKHYGNITFECFLHVLKQIQLKDFSYNVLVLTF